MTEAEWHDCSDPESMLEFLRGKASERKFRLFACACCRRIWRLLTDKRSRAAVECSEGFADGQIEKGELSAVRKEAESAWWGTYRRRASLLQEKEWKIRYAAEAARCVASAAGKPIEHFHRMRLAARAAWAAESQDQGAGSQPGVGRNLLWDIFGNPFRLITLSPAVLTWNDTLVVRLAQVAYDERHLPEGTLDASRLAILADALEEAGCTDAHILGHLRGPGPHVRGCWPVDQLLGKE